MTDPQGPKPEQRDTWPQDNEEQFHRDLTAAVGRMGHVTDCRVVPLTDGTWRGHAKVRRMGRVYRVEIEASLDPADYQGSGIGDQGSDEGAADA